MNTYGLPGERFIHSFFSAMRHSEIAFCVVGSNTATLPSVPSNDIDVICERSDIKAVEGILLSTTRETGAMLAQRSEHGDRGISYVVYVGGRKNGSRYLRIDFSWGLGLGMLELLSARDILEDRRFLNDRLTPLFVASPLNEFRYYFLKRVKKGSLSPEGLAHLRDQLLSDPLGCRSFLTNLYGADAGGRAEALIATGELGTFSGYFEIWRRALATAAHVPSLPDMVGQSLRLVSRIVKPTGFVVGLLGQDGSGKSTVIASLMSRCGPLGQGDIRFHLWPWTPRKRQQAVERPHERQPRRTFASLAKLGFWVAQYNIGWLANVWIARRRCKMIYFDRYFVDALADPRRYRLARVPWAVSVLARIIPQPDIYLVLDVDPAISRSRKDEVDQSEATHLAMEYRKLVGTLRQAIQIDANVEPDNVVDACEMAIVNEMACRLERRLGI